MPPIPPAVKEIEKAKEAAVRPTPTPVEEKPPRVSEPTASGPVAPLAMADTLFSGISTIPSVPSKPATTPSITSEQTKQRSIEPRTPRPPAQPSIEAEPSVRSRPRGKRARTVALWMGAGLLLAAVAIAAATTGLFRSASERSIATGEQAPVRPIDGNPLETRDRKRAVPTAIATPQAEKARIDRVQTEPPARPAKPPEPAAIEDQKVEPLEQPKEHKEPESVETAIEPRPEQDGGAREMLARAIRQLKNGDLDQAEALFRAILKQEPDEHHAMEGLVTILIKRGKGKEALPFCERMVKKRPRRAAYRVLFGDALAMAGNSRAAKEQYNEALRYSPDDKDAKRRLAQTK
jgi:predicted negative regulator of RcsB-dependent stress response